MDYNINQYGWRYYCQLTNHNQEDSAIGRIRSVNKTNFDVITNDGVLKGELTGQLLFSASNDERPQTGDWVTIQIFETQCIITEVLPRHTVIARKVAGRKTDKQVIAANVDVAFIVQGLDRDFNVRRLERMVTALTDAQISPVILLNKADLNTEAKQLKAQIKDNLPQVPCYTLSAINQEGIERIMDLLEAERTYVLIGSSGAGKSTLLNSLMGKETQKTNEVSEAVGKGKHTTTSRELFVLPNGSLVIDTAGVREFGLALENIEAVALTFDDISALAKQCRYTDCSHVNEPGCAVVKALDEGILQHESYDSFIKLRSEAEHYAATQQDKKRKGRDLSKLVRDMKRQNIKKRY